MNSREVRVVVTAAHEGGRGYSEGGTGWVGGFSGAGFVFGLFAGYVGVCFATIR